MYACMYACMHVCTLACTGKPCGKSPPWCLEPRSDTKGKTLWAQHRRMFSGRPQQSCTPSHGGCGNCVLYYVCTLCELCHMTVVKAHDGCVSCVCTSCVCNVLGDLNHALSNPTDMPSHFHPGYPSTVNCLVCLGCLVSLCCACLLLGGSSYWIGMIFEDTPFIIIF